MCCNAVLYSNIVIQFVYSNRVLLYLWKNELQFMFVCSFNGQALRTVLSTAFCRSLMLLSHIGMSSLNTCKLHSYLESLRQMIRARNEKGTCKIFLINTVCTRVMAVGFFFRDLGWKLGVRPLHGEKDTFFFVIIFGGACLYWTTVLACTGSGYSWLLI